MKTTKNKKIKKTIEQINNFERFASSYLTSQNIKDGKSKTFHSKIDFAFYTVTKSYNDEYVNKNEELGQRLMEHKVMFASEDSKTKLILMDDKGRYSYTKENRIALDKKVVEENSLFKKEILEIEPYILSVEITNSFTEIEKEEFKGFFIL